LHLWTALLPLKEWIWPTRTIQTSSNGLASGRNSRSGVFRQRFFRENLKLGDGGETGRDNRMLEETFE